MKPEDLDKIADEYHLNADVPDKFIEDITQWHFCRWLKNASINQGNALNLAMVRTNGKELSIILMAPRLLKVLKN